MYIKAWAAAIAAVCVAWGSDSGQEVPVSTFRDEFFYGQGSRLMGILDVPDGDEAQACSTWSYPTSVVVRGVSYRVDFDPYRDEFTIRGDTNALSVAAHGRVYRRSDGKDARTLAFQTGTMDALESYARKIKVTALDPATNMLYISMRRNASGDKDTLVCRNVVLTIRGGTNRLEFATALMNAGLPEAERVALQTE